MSDIKKDANSIKSELLRELENERVTARRQELLKAIWRLERLNAQPALRESSRPRAVAAVTPEATRRTAQCVQEPDSRAKDRADSRIVTATHQNDHNKSLEGMTEEETLALLNQLYAIERFSLANYLRYAKPRVSPADQYLAEAIRYIGERQSEIADRIGALIIDRRGHVQGDSFPFRFTAYNDLSVAYLAPRVMEDQERVVRQVSPIVRQLGDGAVACDLANEILSAESAHLANLRELLGGQKSEPCHKSGGPALNEQRCQDAAPDVAAAA